MWADQGRGCEVAVAPPAAGYMTAIATAATPACFGPSVTGWRYRGWTLLRRPRPWCPRRRALLGAGAACGAVMDVVAVDPAWRRMTL